MVSLIAAFAALLISIFALLVAGSSDDSEKEKQRLKEHIQKLELEKSQILQVVAEVKADVHGLRSIVEVLSNINNVSTKDHLADAEKALVREY